MKRNIYTNRIVRPLENRKVSVFPAMEYCESCKIYSERKCSNHKVFVSHRVMAFGYALFALSGKYST